MGLSPGGDRLYASRMARGTARAPSQNAYRGALGRTQTATVHVAGPRGDLVAAQVYTTVDAVSDPELVDRLHGEDPARALNVIRLDGAPEPVRVAVPVLYHDPAAELLVLVLADAHRHRELDERIRVLERLRADEAPVPAYAKEFAVVYGPSGLRNYLERRAHEALESARLIESARDVERRRAELAAREGELERTRAEQDKRTREVERRAIELDVAKADLASRAAELDQAGAELERLRSEARNRVIAQAQQATLGPAPDPDGEATLIGPPPEREEVATKPIPRTALRELGAEPARTIDSGLLEGVARALDALELPPAEAETDPGGPVAEADAGAPAAEAAPPEGLPAGADPLTTETAELRIDPPGLRPAPRAEPVGSPPHDSLTLIDAGADPWLDRAAASQTSSAIADASGVRLALVVGEQLARALAGPLDVRVLLHRVATYPVIALIVGSPAALRAPRPGQLAIAVLDIASERDRAVLGALARRFELVVDVVARGRRVRRARLTAPLSDNVGYIMRAAEDHLRGVNAEGEASLARAKELVLGAGFDLLGLEQPDAAEFRDDKLAQLETAQQLRRALAIVRKFARPSREDYLVCLRGFPLPRWRELRHRALEVAVGWGLWMGAELAQIAVSEGLARSRRDLVARLDRGFETLRRHPTAFDLDGDAAEDNAKAIAEEARALGVELHKVRNGAIASDEVSTVSGSIGGTPARGLPRNRSVEELLALLDDKQQRLDAALQLCERADPRAAAPVIAAAAKMSRADAVRVLGKAVKLGAAAKAPLLEGLASSKAFFRHGCALALALLRSDDGTQAVIDLLMTEPTEIWREIARAIGQVGPPALLPLASTYGSLAGSAGPAIAERVAWAMAHIAVRGGKAAVETMAGGQSVVAPVARHALELHASAANDHIQVRPGASGSQPGRDVTVNRAFSRRFFESLDQGMPEAAEAGLIALDEADLIEEDEEPAELDESDLIQT